MGLTLFVYGEVSAPIFEVLPKIEDDTDAMYHLRTCVEDSSRLYQPGSRVMAAHVAITNPEFDNWVETGHWSAETEKFLKDYVKQMKNCEISADIEED